MKQYFLHIFLIVTDIQLSHWEVCKGKIEISNEFDIKEVDQFKSLINIHTIIYTNCS